LPGIENWPEAICNQDFCNETGWEETAVEIKRKCKCKCAGRENEVRKGRPRIVCQITADVKGIKEGKTWSFVNTICENTLQWRNSVHVFSAPKQTAVMKRTTTASYEAP